MAKLNTAADRDRRQLVGATRGRDLYWGFTIGVFANLVTLYLIIQGGDLPQLAMTCLLYTSPSPRDATLSRMPSSA